MIKTRVIQKIFYLICNSNKSAFKIMNQAELPIMDSKPASEKFSVKENCSNNRRLLLPQLIVPNRISIIWESNDRIFTGK